MPVSVFSEVQKQKKHSGDRIALRKILAQCFKTAKVIICLPRAALAWCVSLSLKIGHVILCNVLTEQELLDCASGVYATFFPGAEVF